MKQWLPLLIGYFFSKVLRYQKFKNLESSRDHHQNLLCTFITHLCPTLCDPMECSPPGSSVYRILQARILEWVAISYSRDNILYLLYNTYSLVSVLGRHCIIFTSLRKFKSIALKVLVKLIFFFPNMEKNPLE